jgi:hypothetical protein
VPAHGWLGLGVIVIAETLCCSRATGRGSLVHPIVWTGYVLVADAVAARVTGRSYLTNGRTELPLVVLASIGAWWLFEWYNAPRFWRGAPTGSASGGSITVSSPTPGCGASATTGRSRRSFPRCFSPPPRCVPPSPERA